jgi:hypothetical protein
MAVQKMQVVVQKIRAGCPLLAARDLKELSQTDLRPKIARLTMTDEGMSS